MLGALLLAVMACKEPVDTGVAGGDAGSWEGVQVELDPFRLEWGEGRLDSVSLGVDRDYDSTLNHDPWNMVAMPEVVPAMDWDPVTRASWQGDTLLLHTEGGRLATLERDDEGEGVGLQLTPEQVGPYVRLSFSSAPEEGLYGLGERFDAVDQRGQIVPMQLEVNTALESGYNEVHVPVPFVVSDAGWAVGIESDWPTTVDLAASDPAQLVFTVDTEEPLALRLLGDGDPVQAIAAWTRQSGLPRLPPSWALAPMLWRNENVDDTEVLDDAQAARDSDLAFGVMWVDNPWQTTYNSMQPDGRFVDWDAMVQGLHDRGYRWMAWSTPYVEDADPDHDDYADAGWFVDLPLAFNGFGELVDLTNPDASAAWSARVSAAADIGLQGWKLDYGEDVNLGVGAGRLVTGFANGQDERTMHHRFAGAYHQAYADAYPDGDRFILGRGGAWGTQAVTDCIWPGDLDNDMSEHGEDGQVGGLPAAIRAGVSLSISGFPCFASDTGGYRHGRADRETIIRWTEYSATLPVMQVGGSDQHNYWLLDGDWDQDVLAAGQRYTVLHTRLFPYFQRLLVDASTVGTPPLLPPGLVGADQDDGAFLVGDALFVAPVDEEGAIERDVSLPEGGWVHWWTGERYEGQATVPAPLGEGPLFIAEGGIVPLLRESVRTLAPSDGSVDSWADDPGELVVVHVPGPESSRFEVVDGPTLVASGGELAIGELGIYSGARARVWAPDADTLTLDGVEVDTTRDGPWIEATVGVGTVGWR